MRIGDDTIITTSEGKIIRKDVLVDKNIRFKPEISISQQPDGKVKLKLEKIVIKSFEPEIGYNIKPARCSK